MITEIKNNTMVDGVTKGCEKSGEVSMNVLQVALARIQVFFIFSPFSLPFPCCIFRVPLLVGPLVS